MRRLAFFRPSSTTSAHEIRPALVEIEETGPGIFKVTWKLPGNGHSAIGGLATFWTIQRLVSILPVGT